MAIPNIPALPVTIDNLTEGELTGAGVLDKLLKLSRLHLDREFGLGRIQGKEYSDVYLKLYNASVGEAIRLMLEKEKQPFDFRMAESQIIKMEADTAISNKQLELMAKDLLLKQADLDLKAKELEHKIQMMPLEVALTTAQIDKMQADTALAAKQLILAEKQISLSEKELLLKDKELLLKEKELELAEKQLQLSEQKIITEKAQTDPSVIQEGSVIDMNNKVLAAQVDGFKRDAEQKAANTLLQTWIVRLNNDAALTNNANMLTDKYVGRAVEKMMAGVGMSTEGKDETDLT